MTLYLNDSEQGIVINNYNHNYRLEDGHFNENYFIQVNLNETPATIAYTYENVPITKMVIKNNRMETIKTMENLNLKIIFIDEMIDENNQGITMTLDT